MLVKLEDHKGKVRYINPIFVKTMLAKGEADTEIEISGWSTKLRVKQAMDDVALIINAAMPDAAAYLAAEESERQAKEAAQAAAASVIG